jgi:hypothetical protein
MIGLRGVVEKVLWAIFVVQLDLKAVVAPLLDADLQLMIGRMMDCAMVDQRGRCSR